MYIRFIAGMQIEKKLQHTHGIVTQARVMIDENILYSYHINQVEEIFSQLNISLPCPPFEHNKWPPNAICWFKSSSQEFIQLMYELKYILEEYEAKVTIIRREDIGTVIYEDDYQVVGVSSLL
ncbi:TPA: hypothetical protein ACVO14_002457 [Vibrio alginolyticus]